MASLISGFEYDIFISYRQKDNKGDKWVSRFVDALKTELEATFKEDVSAYFDENPHDRLQETHNVDKSLEGKLKCLIFIPILSQTYCDPNSYAWQYEFLAFDKLAKEDHFGRDIRLKSGNVASRILPIRIHDLEQEDIKLYEKETGSVLRSMDFVFKTSTGVNRPLKANEDHPQDNLNKTFYSDQINKVAHSIKEIILGMKSEPVPVVKSAVVNLQELSKEIKNEEREEVQEKPVKLFQRKLLIGSIALAVLLVVAVILVYPKIFKRNTFEKLRASGERISVAVMPFQNITNDTIWNIWQSGIKDILISYLSNFPEVLDVRSSEAVNELSNDKNFLNYTSLTPSLTRTISKRLDAEIIIAGSIKIAGSVIRVNAQLINPKTSNAYRSFQIQAMDEKEVFAKIDSLSILTKNYLVITLFGKELPKEFQNPKITLSPDAYRYYVYGNRSFYNRDFPTACKMLLEAIRVDSNFVVAMSLLSYAYLNQSLYEDAKKWCLIRRAKRQEMSLNTDPDPLYSGLFEEPKATINIYKLLLINDKQNPITYFMIGNRYNSLNQYEKAIPEYEKQLEIYKGWRSKPRWVTSYTALGLAYHKTGMYGKEKKLYKKAEKDFPDDPDLIFREAVLALSEGKTKDANNDIEKYQSINKESSASEALIAVNLASIYSEGGIQDKAEEFYRKALSLTPFDGQPSMKNTLAYFLIDNDRNVGEGLELVGEALNLQPDNYNFLHTKGWGLYKQGKYQEALNILQKSWDLRREKAVYDHEAFLHLEVAKKAIAGQKN